MTANWNWWKWSLSLWPLSRLADNDTADFGKAKYARIYVTDLKSTDILSYYGRLRDYAEHEDSLINSRLTWSLSIHAFLLTTYGLLLSKAVELLIELTKTCLDVAAGYHAIIRILVGAQIVITLTGFAVGVTSLAAIRAAHKAILTLDAIAAACFPLTPIDGSSHNPISSPAPENTNYPQGILLPCLTGGGAAHNVNTAELYYVGLPKLLSALWALLFLASLVFMAWSLGPISFFRYFDKAKDKCTSATSSQASSIPGPSSVTCSQCAQLMSITQICADSQKSR